MKKSLLNMDFIFVSLAYFFVFFSIAVFYLFPLYLDGFHASKSKVGLIMGIHSVTAILTRPLFGRIFDKRGSRVIAMAGLLIMMISIPGFYFIKGAGALAFLMRALNGIGWGVSTAAIFAICSDLAPVERMAHSLGIIGAAGIVSGAIGPAIAEEIVRRNGFDAVFTTSLIMLAAAFLCIMGIKKMPHRLQSVQEKPSLILRSHPFLTLLIIAAMPIVHGAVRGSVINFIALFSVNAGFGRVGPFFLAFSAAAILTRVGIGDVSDRFGRKRVILPSAFLIGINLFLIAGLYSYWAFVICGFVAGFGQGLIFPALSTYVIDFFGRANKGLALGLYLSLFDVGMGLGSPVFGWISDIAGYRLMYVVAGFLILVSTLVFSFKSPVIPISKANELIDAR